MEHQEHFSGPFADALDLGEMRDDLVIGHFMEAIEIQLAVANVRGQVLYIERLFFREADAAQFRVRPGEHLFRRRELDVGKQRDEAAVDSVGGGACELLKNYRARQCLEALAPGRDSQRTDLGDNPCEDRVGLAKMNPRLARV